MSKKSCKAAESIEDALLRMARGNSNVFFSIRKKSLAYLRKLCYTANVAKKGDGPLLRESY